MEHKVETKQLQESCARAKLWLDEHISVKIRSETSDLGDVLRMLLGYWLCERVLQSTTTPEVLSDLMLHVQNRLYAESEAKTFDPFCYDTKLLLLAHNILSIHSYHPYGIDDFALQVAMAFNELPSIPLRFIGEALLLAQLGYSKYPPVPILEACEAGMDALCLLRADQNQIQSVCQNIAAATHFGRQPLQAAAGVHSYLSHVLPIILLQSLREYNLEIGVTLLRTIRYLHLTDNRATRLAISFLLDQQLVDGKFGHFAIEAMQLSKTHGGDAYDIPNKLYLPMTVSCVWALAEMCGVNLFSLRQS